MGQCCIANKNKIFNQNTDHSTINSLSNLTLNKEQFVFDHTKDNILEEYQIGKILGTGI